MEALLERGDTLGLEHAGDVVEVDELTDGGGPQAIMVGAKFSMDAAMAPVVAPGELCSAVDLSVRFAIDGPAPSAGGGWGFAAAASG